MPDDACNQGEYTGSRIDLANILQHRQLPLSTPAASKWWTRRAICKDVRSLFLRHYWECSNLVFSLLVISPAVVEKPELLLRSWLVGADWHWPLRRQRFHTLALCVKTLWLQPMAEMGNIAQRAVTARGIYGPLPLPCKSPSDRQRRSPWFPETRSFHIASLRRA